ncbi:hypothetical protein [Burkholderia ubonensis]|uniref:hypothetical protein n=1 Tax=Burkholderia ubonensis TaxID=101571 RepID=UPI000A5BDF4C|nr:hypothetical protein [Burkholderia ubonensis]
MLLVLLLSCCCLVAACFAALPAGVGFASWEPGEAANFVHAGSRRFFPEACAEISSLKCLRQTFLIQIKKSLILSQSGTPAVGLAGADRSSFNHWKQSVHFRGHDLRCMSRHTCGNDVKCR